MTIDFGKNHWLLFGVSFFGFIALAYAGRDRSGHLGAEPHTTTTRIGGTDCARDRRAQDLYLRGLRLLSHAASATLEDGRRLGRPSAPATTLTWGRLGCGNRTPRPSSAVSVPGADLSNVGARQASDVWQYLHLYNPRSVVEGSIMPAFPWLFDIKAAAGPQRISGAAATGLMRPPPASSCQTHAGERWLPICSAGVRFRSRDTEERADDGRHVHRAGAPVPRSAAQSNREFSQSTAVHSMTPTYSSAQLRLVAVGVIAVVVTTAYTLLCFIHPGEIGEGHIKRRILDEGCE